MATNSAYLCRFCETPLRQTFVDLGLSPLCESYVSPEQMKEPETLYPLHSFVCEECYLVQLPEYVSPRAIFEEYAYFSSYSDSWLAHAKSYVSDISERLNLNAQSLVIELASNDGYLLQYFLERKIPVLGIEPAKNVAQTAIKKGIPTVTEFFGVKLARKLATEGRQADLLLGNNVLAHVPDINDFVGGMKILLKPTGVITMEFPHLIRLIEENQFDTIYHEHFSYLSFTTVSRIFEAHGLRLFDVDEIKTHGGSLRIYACHADDNSKPVSATAKRLTQTEADWGIAKLEPYTAFTQKVEATKRGLLRFLIETRSAGKTIAGYGAPGKGNTLLNYCGIRTDFLDYTVDRSTYKQGKFTPGTRIPIYAPERIRETKPDFLFILPWNLKDEIMQQCSYIREWGGKFVVPIPEVKVYD
ncbi:MAG: methyltransferase domain-containing protein [Chthoniobacterales bacterium]|nr:methyltransferase domain-containing protein [Chthoniobacterales bacterium]